MLLGQRLNTSENYVLAMQFDEFLSKLYTHQSYEYQLDGADTVIVFNKMFDTETRFERHAVEAHDLSTLLACTHQGKNIQQMTRITGFFSIVEDWNTGKRAELEERHRDIIQE